MKRLLSKIYSERGFSLIEVVASIVIISIVLISFSELFVQANKTAVTNNDKLVAVNLAEAELERLKLAPFSEHLPMINKDSTSPYNQSINNIEKYLYTGGPTYTFSIEASQTPTEKSNNLINVILTVKYKNTSSNVEGYIRYE